MPTGYICIIEEGDGCTFEEYVWRCARAFGATIMMRDDGLDEPITPEIARAERDITYHTEHQAKQDELNRSRVGWMQALAASVPMPAKKKASR